jgi:hypothetical protein
LPIVSVGSLPQIEATFSVQMSDTISCAKIRRLHGVQRSVLNFYKLQTTFGMSDRRSASQTINPHLEQTRTHGHLFPTRIVELLRRWQ